MPVLTSVSSHFSWMILLGATRHQPAADGDGGDRAPVALISNFTGVMIGMIPRDDPSSPS